MHLHTGNKSQSVEIITPKSVSDIGRYFSFPKHISDDRSEFFIPKIKKIPVPFGTGIKSAVLRYYTVHFAASSESFDAVMDISRAFESTSEAHSFARLMLSAVS